MRLAVLGLLCCASCFDTSLPPLGEARVYVDTDLPLDLANRLRVDVYDGTGARWYASFDVPRLEARDWPASFGVRAADDARSRDVMVRLRAYRGGVARDYRGERFLPRADGSDPSATLIAPIPEDEGPRLVIDGKDKTPRLEPEPTAAVDRLARIALTPGRVKTVSVVLRGACAGTMADLANALTCVDHEDVRVSADVAEGAPISKSALGTFGAPAPCTLEARAPQPKLYDDEVCVQGRVFLFGGRLAINGTDSSDQPERVIVEPPFYIDKYEVTVGRFRRARAMGLSAVSVENPGPIDASETIAGCTYTSSGAHDDYPLNCVSYDQARAFCQFFGEDLASETQFEMATTLGAVHPNFPWGNDEPACDVAIYGRFPGSLSANGCIGTSVGPSRTDDPFADVAETGVVNLGGNLMEYSRDAWRALASACWTSQPMLSPRCLDPSAPKTVIRGGGWSVGPRSARVEHRLDNPRTDISTAYGFRCTRSGT